MTQAAAEHPFAQVDGIGDLIEIDLRFGFVEDVDEEAEWEFELLGEDLEHGLVVETEGVDDGAAVLALELLDVFGKVGGVGGGCGSGVHAAKIQGGGGEGKSFVRILFGRLT